MSARYGEVLAVRDLSFTMTAGETLALIGRNGAGKTTVLRVLAGVLNPMPGGDVLWNGESIVALRPEKRAQMGIVLVPEGRGIFPGLTVEENLRIGAYCRRRSGIPLRHAMGEIYDLVPILAERRGQPAGRLSGGEQQMLAIGRALLSRPQLLLLDEPSMGLSPMMVESLYELLGQLKEQGVSFILVEQFVPLALSLCDRAIALRKGIVALAGPAEEVAQGELNDVYMGGHALEGAARNIITSQ